MPVTIVVLKMHEHALQLLQMSSFGYGASTKLVASSTWSRRWKGRKQSARHHKNVSGSRCVCVVWCV